jgi:hypothetical protein
VSPDTPNETPFHETKKDKKEKKLRSTIWNLCSCVKGEEEMKKTSLLKKRILDNPPFDSASSWRAPLPPPADFYLLAAGLFLYN